VRILVIVYTARNSVNDGNSQRGSLSRNAQEPGRQVTVAESQLGDGDAKRSLGRRSAASGPAYEGLRELLRDAACSVVEEVVEPIVKKLLPFIVPEMKSILEAQAAAQGTAVYVSIKRAAEIMDAHPATVRRLIREGKLAPYFLKSEKRVKVGDVHAYMAREGASSPIISVDERARAIMSGRRCG